jgi:hypothetical protein
MVNGWYRCLTKSGTGGFKHDFYFSISYMGCNPKPIDELHHFSRCFLTTNQSLKPTIQPSFNQQPAIDPPKKEAVLGV